jgi:hypothetical protein
MFIIFVAAKVEIFIGSQLFFLQIFYFRKRIAPKNLSQMPENKPCKL